MAPRLGAPLQPRRVLHPLLLGIAPLLLLFSHNRDRLGLSDLLLPLALALAGVAVLWAVASRLLGRNAGALLTTATAVGFLSFGHLRQLAEQAFRFRFGSYEDGLLASAAGLLIVWAGLRLARSEVPASWHAALDGAGLLLVASSILTIATTALRAPDARAPAAEARAAAPADAPDIYYLVLDGYGRSDVLREYFGHDDGPLLDALRRRGFYVAERARANYGQTLFSLAATLNLDYLDELAREAGEDSQDRRPVIEKVGDSRVARILRARGYEIVAFETGYHGTEWHDADRYLAAGEALGEFEAAVLQMTPLAFLARRARQLDAFGQHRRRILFTLGSLPLLARQPGPKFVFAHVVAPHPPFVFLEDGSAAPAAGTFRMQDGSHFLETSSREAYVEGYRAQVAFLSAQVQKALLALLDASPRPPVVIVQGDHGPGSRLDHDSLENTDLFERMGILSAYHLPGPGDAPLHPGITPVNSFRVVLGRYFGEPLPLLPDRSFFAVWERPYAFREVTGALEAAERSPRTAARVP